MGGRIAIVIMPAGVGAERTTGTPPGTIGVVVIVRANVRGVPGAHLYALGMIGIGRACAGSIADTGSISRAGPIADTGTRAR
jgi:hypothetical protein